MKVEFALESAQVESGLFYGFWFESVVGVRVVDVAATIVVAAVLILIVFTFPGQVTTIFQTESYFMAILAGLDFVAAVQVLILLEIGMDM